MRENRTILKENSNHDNDNDDKVDIKANVQSVAQRNWRFQVPISLGGFCRKDYFLNRQLFVFQSYCKLKVYINFVGKHIWCCIHEYYLHNENGFGRDPLRQAFVPWMQKLLIKFVYQYYNHIHLLNLQRAYTCLTMYGTQHLVLFFHSYKVFFT